MRLTGSRGERPRRPERARPRADPPPRSGDRMALWALLAFNILLEITLVAAGWTLAKALPAMQLSPLQQVMCQLGLAGAFVAFGLRALALWRRLRRAPHGESN